MAYDKNKYQLTHLLQEAWYRMGQMRRWIATGGSQTSLINADWAGVEEPQYEDNDPALIYGTVVVMEDAGGAGASPEGEMGMITAYDSSSNTVTMDTLVGSIASGDKVGVASPLFPMEDMIALANLALRKLGEIDILDTSLTTVGSTVEYTLPSTIRKRPIRVRYKFPNITTDTWKPLPNWDVLPATSGADWTLIVPDMVSGYSLEILYRDQHPKLSSFSDFIQPSINPELAVCALVSEAYQWYNNQLSGSNSYFLQRENKALQDLEAAKVSFPIRHIVEQVTGMPHWGRRDDYVPGTSDLRE